MSRTALEYIVMKSRLHQLCLYSLLSIDFVINAKQYILFPKTDYTLVQVQNLAVEYKLDQLAVFKADTGFLPFYVTSEENLEKNMHEISTAFDIEEDQPVSHGLPIARSHHNDKDNQQWDLYAGVTTGLNMGPNEFAPPPVYQHVFEMPEAPSTPVPWHLQRIVSRTVPENRNEKYVYNKPKTCHTNEKVVVDTYIVDTGIDVAHPQFGGRATWLANFADTINTDCNNHGTHVAGLVGSQRYGVCVDAKLYAVKVLDCQGSGSISGVLKGIEYAFRQHVAKERAEKGKRSIKSILNMSLGGPKSQALNKAVEYCLQHNQHFYIVVAAGNENKDSCTVSPASARGMLSIMASDSTDFRGWFSNWGKCAHVYAPGVDIESTIPGGKTATYSGTSMASPIVAGVLNHYLHMYPTKNQSEIIKLFANLATKGVIKYDKQNTVNNLVYLKRNITVCTVLE